MRTTVSIDHALLRRARQQALESSGTLGDVVDDALRMYFARSPGPTSHAVALPTYGGSGLRPGVDLADKEALAGLLDEGDPDRAAG
jgi:hypothetical protein